jgi:hypothetical protein
LPGRAILIMDDSSWHEELTADWIRKTNYTLHSQQMHVNIPMVDMGWLEERTCQTPINGKPCGHVIPQGCIGAHIDGMLQEPMMDEWGYEHKALNHFTFKSLWEEGNYPIDYFTQSTLYYHGTLRVQALKGWMLLIKNKNTAQYLEFLMNYEPKEDKLTVFHKRDSTGDFEDINFVLEHVVERASDKFNKVHELQLAKTLPSRQYNLNDWQCDYCRWGGKCWEGYEAEFKALKESVRFEDDVTVALNYLAELKAEKKRVDSALDEAKQFVLTSMKAKDSREGIAGPYVVKRSLRKRSSPSKELIPKNILKDCMKETIFETLSFTKPGERMKEDDD